MAVGPGTGGTTDPTAGGHTYAEDAVIPITATPAAGYDFVNWTVDVADPDSPSTTVTMDGGKTVTAQNEFNVIRNFCYDTTPKQKSRR